MNRMTKFAAGTLLSVAASVALAAGSPGVERNTQSFLDALAAGGGGDHVAAIADVIAWPHGIGLEVVAAEQLAVALGDEGRPR